MVESSDTGGVRPMSITGRMVRQRERAIGMTPDERLWRAQWLKDQVLTEREPVRVPELERELRNPIRRFYMRPLDELMLKPLTPIMGRENALLIRQMTGKLFLIIAGAYAGIYYFKYNQNDWTKKSGWRVYSSRSRVIPGDPGYPKLSERKNFNDYAERGFKSSPI